MRLVIGPNRRNIALEAAMNAAFEANDEKELSYLVEELIEVAVMAAIDKLEELIA